MTIVTLESFNILILLFLLADYIRKYKKKFTINSFLWFFFCISSIVLSLINIYVSLCIHIDTQIFLTKISYYLSILPIMSVSYYLDINFFGGENNKNKNIVYLTLTAIFMIIMHLFFHNSVEPTFILRHVNDFHPYNSMIIFSLFPLVLIIGYNWISDKKIDKSVLLLLFILLTGFFFSYFFEGITVTHVYTIISMKMYSIKYDKTINNDHLTGAYNRRYLDSYSFSNKKLYAVLVIDVDKFKYINDTYGHDMGDKVLIELVELLNHSVRLNDVVIRTGGDEFVILATIKDKKDVNTLIKRINNNIEIRNETKDIKINISIGSNVYKSSENFKELIDKTDELMYKEKKSKNEKHKKTKNSI